MTHPVTLLHHAKVINHSETLHLVFVQADVKYCVMGDRTVIRCIGLYVSHLRGNPQVEKFLHVSVDPVSLHAVMDLKSSARKFVNVEKSACHPWLQVNIVPASPVAVATMLVHPFLLVLRELHQTAQGLLVAGAQL